MLDVPERQDQINRLMDLAERGLDLCQRVYEKFFDEAYPQRRGSSPREPKLQEADKTRVTIKGERVIAGTNADAELNKYGNVVRSRFSLKSR